MQHGGAVCARLLIRFIFCRSLLLPPQEAAQPNEPEPELEDADTSAAQHASEPSQPVSQQQQTATAAQQQSAGDAMDIETTGDGNDGSAKARQKAGTTVPGKESADHPVQRNHAGNGVCGSAKPSYIAQGSKLVQRSAVPKSYAFADAGSIKTALADAWSAEGDIGKQLAALYELFGDSILPYVPMLPCMSFAV